MTLNLWLPFEFGEWEPPTADERKGETPECVFCFLPLLSRWSGKGASVFLGGFLSCPSATAKSLQSCPALCHSIDSSPPGSPIPGILQARTLEWVAISFSSAWKWKVKVKSLSRVRLLATPWIAAYQAPPSMGFSRQEYWSGMPSPSPSCPSAWGVIMTSCIISFQEHQYPLLISEILFSK